MDRLLSRRRRRAPIEAASDVGSAVEPPGSRRTGGRRWGGVLLLAALVTSGLSACGGPEPQARSTPTRTALPATPPPSPTASGTPPAGASPSATAAPSYRQVPAGLAGREWTYIPTQSKVVALTFDAGANADGVASIIGTLKQDQVRATFFLTGDFVEKFPAPSRAIAAAGERIGDHSVSHPYFTDLSNEAIRQQVLQAESQIRSITGADPWPFFRFPYLDRDSRTIAVVNSVGFAAIGVTVDTLGWKGTSSGITVDSIVARVLASLRPGEIVLMHCGSNPTDHSTLDAAALPQVIAELRARGYSFVTLDAILS